MAQRLLHELASMAYGKSKAIVLAWFYQNLAILITAFFALGFAVWAFYLFRPGKKPKSKPRARIRTSTKSDEPEPEPEPDEDLEVETTTSHLIVDSEKKRQAMLKALGNAKRVNCALLAIDVVGSTQMKADEKDAVIAASFAAYRQFVEKVLAEHRVWKQAWTPDGVMSAFRNRKSALAAAQGLLKGLTKFNEQGNRLKTPFRVRCGMNEGSLALFADSELQDLADRVIDIAGHMQKDARENTVWVPDVMYRELEDIRGFRATAKFVDGFEAYEWAIRD